MRHTALRLIAGSSLLCLLPTKSAVGQVDGSASLPAPSFVKVGIGLGVPYGVLGVGAEAGTGQVSLLGGVGTALYGSGHSFGARVYAAPATARFRPHLTAVYGTTVAYDIIQQREISGTLNGFAVYAGADLDVGRPGGFGMTYGVGYITHEALPSPLTESQVGTRIKVMIGLNWRFGIGGK